MSLSHLEARLRGYLIAHVHLAASTQKVRDWLAANVTERDEDLERLPEELLSIMTVHYDTAWEHGLGLDWQADAGFHRIGKVLEQIGVHEHRHGRPHLTACCVRRGGQPGEGFAGLVRRLSGSPKGNPGLLWRWELVRVARWWGMALPVDAVDATGDFPRLVHDPTLIADAHHERLVKHIKRLE